MNSCFQHLFNKAYLWTHRAPNTTHSRFLLHESCRPVINIAANIFIKMANSFLLINTCFLCSAVTKISIQHLQMTAISFWLPEPLMMDSTLTTAVSSLKRSGCRGTEQFSDFCRAAPPWAGTWRGRPWASTKERAMQAIPERAGNVFKRPTSNHQSLGRSLVFNS